MIYDPKEHFSSRREYLTKSLVETTRLRLFIGLFIGLTIFWPALVLYIEGEFRKGPLSLILFLYAFLGFTFLMIFIMRFIAGFKEWNTEIDLGTKIVQVRALEGSIELTSSELRAWRLYKSHCRIQYRLQEGYKYGELYLVFPGKIPESFSNHIKDNFSNS